MKFNNGQKSSAKVFAAWTVLMDLTSIDSRSPTKYGPPKYMYYHRIPFGTKIGLVDQV